MQGEEIERLRAQLVQEEARRSPTPRAHRAKVSKPVRPVSPLPNFVEPSTQTQTDTFAPCTRQHYDDPPARPSTAPLPTQRQKAPAPRQRSYEAYPDVRPPSEPRASTLIDEADLETSFARADEIFRSVSAPKVDATPSSGAGMCSVCRRRKRGEPGSAPARMEGWEADDEAVRQRARKEDPQMALVKVLRDLEEDFEQHKRYVLCLCACMRRELTREG